MNRTPASRALPAEQKPRSTAAPPSQCAAAMRYHHHNHLPSDFTAHLWAPEHAVCGPVRRARARCVPESGSV